MPHWEERVTDAQIVKINAAVSKFEKKSRPSRDDEHALYDVLTSNGMTAEEADEYTSLLMESR